MMSYLKTYLKQQMKQARFRRIGGLLFADLLLFGTTDPSKVASFTLIIAFLLLCATLYYTLGGLLALAKLYGVPVRRKKRILRLATIIGSALIAFQSIGQLSVRDIAVLVPLSALWYMYAGYTKNSRQLTATRPFNTTDTA